MKLTVTAAAALAVLAAGCGAADQRATTDTPPASPTATAAPPGGPAAAAVTIEGFAYDPPRVTVRRGGEVTWTDEDAANHTVTFSDPGPKDIENLREGRSATVTFKQSGRYAYVCDFHPGMAGTVVVE